MQPQIQALFDRLQVEIAAIKRDGVGGDTTAINGASTTALTTLSGSIDAAITSLSSSFVIAIGYLTGTGITSVVHDTSLSGGGIGGNPLTAIPVYTVLQAGITASVGNAYAVLQTAGTASYTVLQTGVTSSLGSLYTSVTTGATASIGNAYSVLQTGLTASIGNAYTVLQTGVTASINSLSGTVNSAIVDAYSSIQVGVTAALSPFGSISITSGAPPAAVNLTTEGSIDWVYTPTSPAPLWSLNPASNHTKVVGGWLYHTVDNINIGGASTNGTSIPGTGFTATSTDDTAGAAPLTSGTTYSTFYTSTSTPINYGFRFRVPARSTKQVIRAYLSLYNGGVTVSASLGASSAQTSHVLAVGAAQTNKLVTITFSGTLGDELNVRILQSFNSGSAALSMAAVTIGTA